jgi:hypothetical protein
MGSKTNPMWVKMVEGAGAGVGSAAGSIFASLFSKDSSSAAGGKAVGGVLGGLGSLLTHFATGGDVMAGVPFRGGELGEEAFVASVPGRVIPHNQLGGNTWHIDARGADPALTQANFIRGLQMARAGGAADAMHGISERQRRTAQ